MSQIKLQTNASGTGAVVLAAPNTNNTVTVNLPDTAGNTGASAVATTDANGNLGLGVTTSAWGAGIKAIDSSSCGGFIGTTGGVTVASNAYYNGSNWIYKTSTHASYYEQNQANQGKHAWFTAPSGTAGNPITFTQAMTLDASGNLGVGTTNPADFNGRIVGVANSTSGSGLVAVSSSNGVADPARITLYQPGNDTFAIEGGSLGLRFMQSSITERARIDSSGNLNIGQTSAGTINANGLSLFPSIGAVAYNHLAGTASGTAFANFALGGNVIGSITQSGTTSVSYNTSSDYRLKHDIAPMQNALQRVAALKPCTYKWNADGSDGEGFIAHELAEVCPQAVTGEKDAVDADGKPVYQGIDTSFLVATLTAAIQEQQAIITAQQSAIDSLTARIEALEAK